MSAVQTAEEALLLYERYGARLVVLDIMLPGRDGFYVLEKYCQCLLFRKAVAAPNLSENVFLA